MKQPNLLEQAKQGDPKAIAALMHRSLQHQGISLDVTLREGCLQILLESPEIPNQDFLVAFIRKGLTSLRSEAIHSVRIYGQKQDESFPDWTVEFELRAGPLSHLPIETPAQKSNLKELARQGDETALTVLLNRALEHKSIITKALWQSDYLHLGLESPQVPDEKTAITLIQRELVRLKLELQAIKVYGKQIGAEFPAWSRELDLNSLQNLPLTFAPVTKGSNQTNHQTISQKFQLADLLPYQEVFNVDLYSNGIVRLLLFFSLFPLVARLVFGEAEQLELTAWILGIYYAFIWGVVLYDLIKPTQFSWSYVLKCVLFTAFIGIPLLLFMQRVPPFNLLYAATRGGLLERTVGFVLGVGVLEEICKAAPVYLLLSRTGKVKDPLNTAFYGAMSGLGFAIAEGVEYSLRYAWGLTEGEVGFGAYILINTIRFISLPLFHAIWSATVGFFLGLAAINPSRQIVIIAVGISISAVLHGLYDVFANNLLGIVIIAFSILLFVTYLWRSKQMAAEMRQAELVYQKAFQRSHPES